jgi:eukaryotic-like serine/threonine-protein kinase
MKIYRFRNFYFNPTERRLIKNGQFLELTTKTFDVLQLLIENGNEIVTKDEILGKVWNGSFVEEGNLPVHVSKLRRLLDEDKNQQFIETIQGSGYRFTAPVNEVSQAEWEKNLSDVDLTPPDKASSEWIFDSIAVLPLQNENGDDEIDYLADGLTESFINSLSRLPNLKVIARNTVFHYKNKNTDAREVGETLGVATILTGRIRIIKDRLIIGIELTKTQDGTQLWGTHFNRLFTDIFEIQDSIISEVLENLKSEINHTFKAFANNTITQNPESYKLYLKGAYLIERYTEENLYKAIQYFEQSVSHDPLNVHSYVGMIECYFLLYFIDYLTFSETIVKISPLISIVSKLNPNIDVAQAMYGTKKMYFDWKFKEAENHLKKALTLNHNCLIARHRYSNLLLIMGRFSEALEETKLILAIDPISLIYYKRASRILYRMERFETALTYLKNVIELEPSDYEALVLLGAVLTEIGNYDEALSVLEKSLNVQYNLDTLSMLGCVYALMQNKNKAYDIINKIRFQSKTNFQCSIKLARIYLALEEKELAYSFLEKAIKEHDVDVIGLKTDPRLSAMRDDLRFKELIFSIGLEIVRD